MVSAKLQFPRMATGENPLILATAKGNTVRHGGNHSAMKGGISVTDTSKPRYRKSHEPHS